MSLDPIDSRYHRQVVLPEIGLEGQRRLLSRSVLVVGCGALGGHLAQTMVRAGIGRILLIDRDVPEIHNLHRQVLFDEHDVQARIPKAIAAANHLKTVNAKTVLEPHVLHVDASNIEALVAQVDLVLDGTDNFATRYVVNDACVKLGIPWIYGGVQGTTGTMMPVLPGKGPCLRCVLPHPPAPGPSPTDATFGVLNTVPAIVAALQCTEAFKILTETPVVPTLITIEAWKNRFLQVALEKHEDCPTCAKHVFTFLNEKR